MPRRKSLRSQLYRGARDLGSVEAAEQGPTAYGKRVVRRAAYRKTNSGLGSLLRAFGLSGAGGGRFPPVALRMVKIGSLTMGGSALDESRVAHYVKSFDRAEPIVVYEDSERSEMTVAAGHHRVEAARRLGLTEIKAEVRPGTRYDATKYADFGLRVKHSERFRAEA